MTPGTGPGCRRCGDTGAVVDSRPFVFKGVRCIKRRRLCSCGVRWTTFEIREDELINLADHVVDHAVVLQLRNLANLLEEGKG